MTLPHTFTLGEVRCLKFVVGVFKHVQQRGGPRPDQSTIDSVTRKIDGRGPGGRLELSRQEVLSASSMVLATGAVLAMNPQLVIDGIPAPSMADLKALREKLERLAQQMDLN